jgi:hypothetical protein
MKVKILLLCLLISGSSLMADDILYSNPFTPKVQKPNISLDERPRKSNWKERISFGGAASVNFGTVTFILLNPQIFYRIDDKTFIGAGPYWQYISQPFGGTRLRSSIYGATATGRRFITEDLFLQAEYNYLNFETGTGRTSQGFGMAGAGYQPHPNFNISVMYIFTDDPNGYLPFGGSPWVIRGGIFL